METTMLEEKPQAVSAERGAARNPGMTPPDAAPRPELPGVVAVLGTLGAGALVTEAGLAAMMDRHPTSIKRAVARGELPVPVRFMGEPTWTVGALLKFFERRLEEAAQDRDRFQRKISEMRP